MAGLKVEIENFGTFMSGVDKWSKEAGHAMKDTVADIKKRAPGWVAKEVAAVYNVSAGAVKSGGTLGKVRISGDAEGLEIQYSGRHLSPQHFSQTPKSGKSSDYTVSMTVHRGSRVKIGQHKKKKQRGGPYSQQSGNFPMLNGQTMVARRRSPNRDDIEVFKTTSLPQMVLNDALTTSRVEQRVGEESMKRLEHNLERYLG